MVAPQPATIAGALDGKIKDLLVQQTHYLASSDLQVRRLAREAEKLMKANAIEGSLSMAAIHHLFGDWDGVLRWLSNARSNQGRAYDIDRRAMACAGNLGFFSVAAGHFLNVCTVDTGTLSRDVRFGLACGRPNTFLEGVGQLARAGLDLPEASMVSVANDASAALARLGVPEEVITQMLDVAGEVMRDHSLFWQEDLPVVRAACDDQQVGVLYQFFIGVGPDQAEELSDEVLDRMISRGVYRRGINFSFIGTDGLDESAWSSGGSTPNTASESKNEG